MHYKIVNIETGETVYTEDTALAIARSYEPDVYDVEILEEAADTA